MTETEVIHDVEDMCAICHSEKKKDPVVLECGHSYCCNCLIDLLQHAVLSAHARSPDGDPNSPALDTEDGPEMLNRQEDRGHGHGNNNSGGHEHEHGGCVCSRVKCPQCRKPIRLMVPRTRHDYLTRRLEKASKNIQREFRRRNAANANNNRAARARSSTSTIAEGKVARLLVCSLLVAILGLIQAALLPGSPSDSSSNSILCYPVGVQKIVNAVILSFAILGISFSQCHLWIRFRHPLRFAYIIVALLSAISTCTEATRAARGCTLPFIAAGLVSINLLNASALFYISTLLNFDVNNNNNSQTRNTTPNEEEQNLQANRNRQTQPTSSQPATSSFIAPSPNVTSADITSPNHDEHQNAELEAVVTQGAE
ncbi:uncharacterized protein LOC142344562 isoform X2 [Convolutriloba macropyga]|uniref:uncharacterized protein LOC142344562 isoform X2 n=1 Tax=Convolutriloba macropyga TaxID=536237 RepID=UPI003F5276F5